MQGIKYLITITHREFSEQYLDSLKQNGINFVTSTLCQGTAKDSVLDLLDIEKTDKVMIEAMVRDEQVKGVKNSLIEELSIYTPGNGIAVFIPVDGIGGTYAKTRLLGESELSKEKEEVEEKISKAVLIIVICDKGNSDIVMDAAREGGATGGTVVRAQGTGAEIAKFFGVTISEEKEMIYIVASRESRDAIMYKIMEKAGKDTDAHGIVFSLPIDSVVGIRSLED